VRKYDNYPKKQIILVIMLILTIFYSLSYHRPILNSWEAHEKAYEHLKYRAEEWGLGTYWRDIDIEELEQKELSTVLWSEGGILGGVTNRRFWYVTIIDSERHITVVLNAHTGKLIDFFGPLN